MLLLLKIAWGFCRTLVNAHPVNEEICDFWFESVMLLVQEIMQIEYSLQGVSWEFRVTLERYSSKTASLIARALALQEADETPYIKEMGVKIASLVERLDANRSPNMQETDPHNVHGSKMITFLLLLIRQEMLLLYMSVKWSLQRLREQDAILHPMCNHLIHIIFRRENFPKNCSILKSTEW